MQGLSRNPVGNTTPFPFIFTLILLGAVLLLGMKAKGKADRAAERAQTERRIRDEIEIRKKIEAE